MKRSLILLSLISIIFFACKKDNLVAVLSSNVIAPEILTPATSTTVTFTKADSAQKYAIHWEKADFGVPVVVDYIIQADESGKNFSTAKTLGTTTSDSLMFTIYSLNNKLIDVMKLPVNAESKIEVRVVGIFKKDTVISSPVSLTVTPYQTIVEIVYPALYVAGDFQAWDINNATRISAFKTAKLYEGYLNIAGGTREFKLYTFKDWNSESYGKGDENALILANYAGGNLSAPSNGYYQLTANLNTMQYTLTKTTWSILGDATPGGWTTDTQMTYDPVRQVWTLVANMKADGSFKFRANNAWALDFGINGDGKLSYANHPVLGYTDGLRNISVPSDGTYTLTLDLHNANNYTYSLVKN